MPLRSRNLWWGVTLNAPDARELARFYAPFCLCIEA